MRLSGSLVKQRHFDKYAGETPWCICCGEDLRMVLSLNPEKLPICLNCKWAASQNGGICPHGDIRPDVKKDETLG